MFAARLLINERRYKARISIIMHRHETRPWNTQSTDWPRGHWGPMRIAKHFIFLHRGIARSFLSEPNSSTRNRKA